MFGSPVKQPDTTLRPWRWVNANRSAAGDVGDDNRIAKGRESSFLSKGVNIELDHIFIMSSVDAPEAARLQRLGLREGSPNTHPGQGTACRRFFFRNAYLELAWVCDPQEAQGEQVRRAGLWDRWINRHEGACPFGIALRPDKSDQAQTPPFDAWEYRPPYLPAPLAIQIAVNTPASEPEFFYLAFRRDRARLGAEPTTHAIPVTDITNVTIGSPVPVASAAARAVGAAGWFSVKSADRYVMSLSFNGAVSGASADLRPELPLVLRW